jgi:hypothetical protein
MVRRTVIRPADQETCYEAVFGRQWVADLQVSIANLASAQKPPPALCTSGQQLIRDLIACTLNRL